MMKFLANLIAIGRSTVVDDSGEVQLIQVTEGARGTGGSDRVTDHVVRMTEFGFSSVPPADTEVLVIRRSADRSKSTVIATSHRASRPKNLQPGDVCVYDNRGAKVTFTSSGIVVDSGGQPVTVMGDLHVTGEVVIHTGGTPITLGTHIHTGVSTGGGVSGPPR